MLSADLPRVSARHGPLATPELGRIVGCGANAAEKGRVSYLVAAGTSLAVSFRRSHAVRAVSRAELLVDGDVHSLGSVQKAIQLLAKEGRAVKATIFGPPGGRRKNREWNQFLQRRNVVFRPVARGQDERREATDEAIHDKIKSLARAKGVDFVALLSSDQGFLSPLQQCIASGTKVALFVPETCFGAIKFYKGNGVHVRKLPVEQNSCHIRALLHADGRGTVNRAEAYEGCLTDEAVTELEGFLQDWGEPSCFLIQLLAKFWFVNSLGTLTVFPLQHGVMAARDVITSASSVQSWQSCGQQLAFVLPVAGVGKAANFGSGLARRIFYGGGPFMLSDSANLTCAALTKLGYLDEDLNTDLTEAILCFINATDNKTKLRKLDLLPADHAEARQIDAQLRQAFLSNRTDAQWRVGPRCSAQVQSIFVASELLPRGPVPRGELFAAMGAYIQRRNLPEMQTFNGRAWRIMRSRDRCPTTRGVIEVARS